MYGCDASCRLKLTRNSSTTKRAEHSARNTRIRPRGYVRVRSGDRAHCCVARRGRRPAPAARAPGPSRHASRARLSINYDIMAKSITAGAFAPWLPGLTLTLTRHRLFTSSFFHALRKHAVVSTVVMLMALLWLLHHLQPLRPCHPRQRLRHRHTRLLLCDLFCLYRRPQNLLEQRFFMVQARCNLRHLICLSSSHVRCIFF